MTDFTQTAVSMSAKRELTVPISDLDTFEGVISALLSDETMGLTRKEAGSTSYTAKIVYFDADANEAAKISFNADDRDRYESAAAYLLGNETAETIAGIGASASEEEDKSLWNARISCAIGDDTFSLSLNRDSITISGYAKAETLAAVEAWADTVDALA